MEIELNYNIDVSNKKNYFNKNITHHHTLINEI